MKRLLLPLAIFIITLQLFAQEIDFDKISGQILTEGLLLYNLERASWISTDEMTANLDMSSIDSTNGYFTYKKRGIYHSLYLNIVNGKPHVFREYKFKDTVNMHTMEVVAEPRPLDQYEEQLNDLRFKIYTELRQDSMFRMPEGSQFNFVFTDQQDTFKIYLITSTRQNFLIPFGNDYLFKFDFHSNLIGKEKLHESFIPIDYDSRNRNQDEEMTHTIHNHLPGHSPFVTATDICNLMLYGPRDRSIALIVISREYVSIFSPKGQPFLTIMTTDTFKNIGDDEPDENSKEKDK